MKDVFAQQFSAGFIIMSAFEHSSAFLVSTVGHCVPSNTFSVIDEGGDPSYVIVCRFSQNANAPCSTLVNDAGKEKLTTAVE